MPSVESPGQLLASATEAYPFRLEDLGALPQPKVGLGVRLGSVTISVDPPMTTDALPGGYFQVGTRSRSVQPIPNPVSVVDGTIAEDQQPLASHWPLFVGR